MALSAESEVRIVVAPTLVLEVRAYILSNLHQLLVRRYHISDAEAARAATVMDMVCAQSAMCAVPASAWFARSDATSHVSRAAAGAGATVRSLYVRNMQTMMDAIVCRPKEQFVQEVARDGCAQWLTHPGGPQHELWTEYIRGREQSIRMLHHDWKAIAEHLNKGNHTCPVCRGKNVAPRDKQTRRGDEGSTIFYHCHDCDKVFRVGEG